MTSEHGPDEVLRAYPTPSGSSRMKPLWIPAGATGRKNRGLQVRVLPALYGKAPLARCSRFPAGRRHRVLVPAFGTCSAPKLGPSAIVLSPTSDFGASTAPRTSVSRTRRSAPAGSASSTWRQQGDRLVSALGPRRLDPRPRRGTVARGLTYREVGARIGQTRKFVSEALDELADEIRDVARWFRRRARSALRGAARLAAARCSARGDRGPASAGPRL
jgi:hypothetical protein